MRHSGCRELTTQQSPPTQKLKRFSLKKKAKIVTTLAEDGTVNCAPMGVEWDERVIVLKPFVETATYRNVIATRAAVVNVVDDVRVFARAAIANPEYPTVPAVIVPGDPASSPK